MNIHKITSHRHVSILVSGQAAKNLANVKQGSYTGLRTF